MSGAAITVMTRERYSRKQTLDVKTAMATALTRLLAAETFPGPRGQGKVRFLKVFAEWPTSNDVATLPAAGILSSDDTVRYAPARLTPSLMEDTWEPAGRRGLGLYKLSEAECEFKVETRARTQLERSALVAGVEALLFAPGVLNNREEGARYGRVAAMPEYWGLPVRFALRDKVTGDDAAGAKSGRWEATFSVLAQAPHVRLDVVSPFRVKIREIFE